jgi:hypothetical protein
MWPIRPQKQRRQQGVGTLIVQTRREQAMRTIALAAGAILAVLATGASAQYYSRDGRWVQRADGDQECWNPHAGHFERVRPGERQDDLDFSRCRYLGGRVYDAPIVQPAPVYTPPAEPGVGYAPGYGYYERGAYGRAGDECWNPHAGHYEQVRPGEQQGDLDYSRCRPAGSAYRYR